MKKTYVFLLFYWLLISISFNGFAQNEWSCGGPQSPPNNNNINSSCGMSSSSWVNKYSKVATYLPFANSPAKVIGVNFIVMRDNSGGNGFPNNTASVNELNTIFGYMRNVIANNTPPSDPIAGVTDLTSKFIDVELKGIYFYDNTTLNTSTSTTAMINYLNLNYPDRLQYLNIVINEAAHGVAYATRGSSYGTGANLCVIMPGIWSWSPGSDYASATTMAHEIGHTLDLCHTYLGGGCASTLSGMGTNPDVGDWFPDIFGTPYPGNAPHHIYLFQ